MSSPIHLDEIDKKILTILQNDARTPFSKIARELGVSEATVFIRVKKMMKAGVIKGFRAVVSPQHVGKSLSAFVLVKADPRKYERVLEVVKKLDDVVEAYDVTGPYYAILKVVASDKEGLARLIDAIGAVDGVLSTETAVVLREIKETSGIKLT